MQINAINISFSHSFNTRQFTYNRTMDIKITITNNIRLFFIFIFIYIYIYFTCLCVCFVCQFVSINVKTTDPIRPKFCEVQDLGACERICWPPPLATLYGPPLKLLFHFLLCYYSILFTLPLQVLINYLCKIHQIIPRSTVV